MSQIRYIMDMCYIQSHVQMLGFGLFSFRNVNDDNDDDDNE